MILRARAHILRRADQDWTKEETDYLFDLVRDYDGRFYIVHDRYEYVHPDSKKPERTLEVHPHTFYIGPHL